MKRPDVALRVSEGALEAVLPAEARPGESFWLQGRLYVAQVISPPDGQRRLVVVLDEIVLDSPQTDSS